MSQQLRVVDLAHTMGITPSELIFKLRSIGVSVASEEDNLDLSTVRAIITGETLQRRPREVIVRSEIDQEERTATSARDRVARRRRRIIKTDGDIKEVESAVLDRAGEIEDVAQPAFEDVEFEAEADDIDVDVPDEVEVSEVAETVVPDETEASEPAELPEPAKVRKVVEPVIPVVVVAAGIESEVTEPPVTKAEEVVADKPAKEAVGAVKGEKARPKHKPARPQETETSESLVADVDESKPQPKVTEAELINDRPKVPQGPQRVRPVRAKTPLERNLRELSPEEIKQRLSDQKIADANRKAAKVAGKGGDRKSKSAADAREIRDLLNKFEEQKLKGQGEAPAPSSRPSGGPRPGGANKQQYPRKAKGGRKNKGQGQSQTEIDRRTAPPAPTRTLAFKDGIKPEGPIVLSEMVTARELAEKLNLTAKDLLGLLIMKGTMVTTNQPLPHEIAEEICADLGIDAMVASAEDLIEFEREENLEVIGELKPRPPVVTVMGHVDHGKTSLLDALRSSRVAEHEAGGITQHIGASRIETDDGKVVVFIDTPGHEAFTQMRARGAQVTDIVVLVVAADDGVMPQTLEAIAHAKAANVPLIVAVNKIDKNNANPERVKQQLAERDVLIEEWGGDIPAVMVSAKSGVGISDLLDMILLVAEVRDLKATEEGPARGVVLEAQKEKGRGIVATVIIQQGTLEIGSFFFCGATWGRVRALTNADGNRVMSAGPATPVEIMGFEGVPQAGDFLQGTENENQATEVSSFRSQRQKEEGMTTHRKVSLENLFDHMEESDAKELNVVIKADVQGSVEVLKATLSQLGTEKININVLHSSVGAITTNDVMLAAASSAIIIGFSVRPERTAKELAESEQVDIRLYTVIYDLVDDVKLAMVGLLDAEYREETLGRAEVREVFKVPKIGSIAGCHVTEGIIVRNAKVRLLRDNIVIHEGAISSLRRFKDDAAEVRQGFECGIGIERYQDIKDGDIIEAFKMIEIPAEL